MYIQTSTYRGRLLFLLDLLLLVLNLLQSVELLPLQLVCQ